MVETKNLRQSGDFSILSSFEKESDTAPSLYPCFSKDGDGMHFPSLHRAAAANICDAIRSNGIHRESSPDESLSQLSELSLEQNLSEQYSLGGHHETCTSTTYISHISKSVNSLKRQTREDNSSLSLYDKKSLNVKVSFI